MCRSIALVSMILVMTVTTPSHAGAIRYVVKPVTLSNGYAISGGFIETNTSGPLMESDITDYQITVEGEVPHTFSPSNLGSSIDITSTVLATDGKIIIPVPTVPFETNTLAFTSTLNTHPGCVDCRQNLDFSSTNAGFVHVTGLLYSTTDMSPLGEGPEVYGQITDFDQQQTVVASVHITAIDTDGDGLLDLIDLPFFDAVASGIGDYTDRFVEDLDGANQLTNLQRIELGDNRIRSIEPGDFDRLPNLEHVGLGSNQITRIERGNFDGLTNLQQLELGQNQIARIERGDFDGLTNLQQLGLAGNQITSIERGNFDGLTNLQQLELGQNQIASIEHGDFDGLTNLQQLGLAGNQITSIESGDFDGLASLQSLELRSNQIMSIESGDFDGLTNLQSLSLSSNQITSIESGDFDGLAKLQRLALGSNQITSIESGDFDGLTNLREYLSLYGNQITSIERGDFDGLANLQHQLELGRNQVTSIESGAFDGLASLQQLALDHNQITSIESGDFDGLASLQSLALRSNQIMSIESGDFDGLTNLQSLGLGSNQIASIESGDFDGLVHLLRLALNHNQITSIESGDFAGLTNLHSLDMSYNQITSIESGAFKGFTSLRSLELQGNDLTELNFTDATFDALSTCGIFSSGFCADISEITDFVLDDAVLSLGAFDAILHQGGSEYELLTDVSLVGLTFSDENPGDLDRLLGIASLNNVTVDPSLYALYADEFNTFDALEGNTVTVVPEPSSTVLLLVGLIGNATRRRRRYRSCQLSRCFSAYVRLYNKDEAKNVSD